MIPPAHLKEQIVKAREARLAICAECEWHSKKHKTKRPDEHCTKCGCTLSAKAACLSCSCPLNKWVAIMTGEQEDEMDKTIKI